MPRLFSLIKLLIIFLQLTCHFSCGFLINTQVISADGNKSLTLVLNQTIEYIIQYPMEQSKKPLRVFARSSDALRENPILVMARQGKESTIWQIPMRDEGPGAPETFMNGAHTLCSDYQSANSTLFIPFVSLSTSSPQNVSVTVHVELSEDYYIGLNKVHKAVVTPSQPNFYFFDFFHFNETYTLDSSKNVVLQVTSTDDVCMIVSIQNSSCPVYDLNRNIKFEGLWETMTRKGGISIPKSKFPNGFFVVFVPTIDDLECNGDDLIDSHNRTKTVEFLIKASISFEDYVNAIMATIACIFLFYIVFGVSFFICSNRVYIPRTMEYLSRTSPSTSMVNGCNNDFESAALDAVSNETAYDAIAETIVDREQLILNKKDIFLSDLARKDFRILRKKSYSYLWHVLTVALFYGLPVVQLVITYQRVLNNTGNQDLCYYNFWCAHPLDQLSDFNHFFSNIGYVALGILFLWNVHRRERWHKDTHFDQQYGIPQHYGMFYAMGVALTMEGVLSASYHVCPNSTNFQFDSSFMYVIAVLSMVKIYQTRHPDINATAYSTFGILGVAIVLGMWGILAPSLYFWIGFTIFHFILGFYLTAYIYYMGCWKLGLRNYVRSIANDFYGAPLKTLKPTYTGQFVLLVIGNLCNWLFGIFGILYNRHDFAMHLLGVFMMNVILYFIFYNVMKILKKERINTLALLFLVISLSCAVSALYCFMNKSISWASTPALSRTLNQECKLFRFYDYHDIWHFLSAVGMFFMFMVLLLLDDDLSHTDRSTIHVF